MRSTTTVALLAAAACVGSVQALSYSHGHQNARRHHEVARRSSKHDEPAQVIRGRMARKMRRAAASDNKQTYESTAIWWAEAGWIGSCGDNVSDDAMIIALPLALYPDVSTASPLCGTTVSVSAPSTGKSITATVIGASDRTAYTTFSRAAYEALGGNLDSGELPIEFELVDGTAPASASVTASDGAALKSVASAAVKASSAGSSSSAAGVKSSSSSSEEASSSSSSSSNSSGKAFASGSSANVHAAAAPSTAAPTTTEAPQTTTTTQAPTTPAWDSASAASESAKSKSLADAAWASSSSASAAEAYGFWASSSSSAAAAAASAASKSSADAAWASSSSASAAAAAASKSSADAAWASSSSAAAAAAWASSSSAAAAAKPTQDSSPSSGGGHVYSGGLATFFYQNGVAGNCGKVNSDDTLLVALPTATYAGGSHCGQYVEITRSDTGKKIKALVADSCPTCNNDSCLDLSWGAFSALGGTQSMGVFDITWQFV
ncbi:hypothetical protein JCM8115_003023 [Rhodotorula mucilaginosa]